MLHGAAVGKECKTVPVRSLRRDTYSGSALQVIRAVSYSSIPERLPAAGADTAFCRLSQPCTGTGATSRTPVRTGYALLGCSDSCYRTRSVPSVRAAWAAGSAAGSRSRRALSWCRWTDSRIRFLIPDRRSVHGSGLPETSSPRKYPETRRYRSAGA